MEISDEYIKFKNNTNNMEVNYLIITDISYSYHKYEKNDPRFIYLDNNKYTNIDYLSYHIKYIVYYGHYFKNINKLPPELNELHISKSVINIYHNRYDSLCNLPPLLISIMCKNYNIKPNIFNNLPYKLQFLIFKGIYNYKSLCNLFLNNFSSNTMLITVQTILFQCDVDYMNDIDDTKYLINLNKNKYKNIEFNFKDFLNKICGHINLYI